MASLSWLMVGGTNKPFKRFHSHICWTYVLAVSIRCIFPIGSVPGLHRHLSTVSYVIRFLLENPWWTRREHCTSVMVWTNVPQISIIMCRGGHVGVNMILHIATIVVWLIRCCTAISLIFPRPAGSLDKHGFLNLEWHSATITGHHRMHMSEW